MNIFLTFFFILTILISAVTIVTSIVGYIKFKQVEKPSHYTVYNDKFCGAITCKTKIVDYTNVPQQKTEEYQKDMAQYCANLVYRIEQAVVDTYKPPKILKQELEMYDLEDKVAFGIIWSYDNIVFIAFRGTAYSEEWQQNFTYEEELFPQSKPQKQSQITFLRDVNTSNAPSVHTGFLNVYDRFRDKLIAKVRELNPKQIIVSGHSLGASVATICSLDLQLLKYNVISYVFASPRVGDTVFCKLIQSSGLKLYSIINMVDLIPTIPPSVSPNLDDPENPYIFTNCGEIITFTDNRLSLLNNHLMPVYMNYLQT
jgi:triacylglycerol lipase